jgi:hypothetical protein
VTERLLQSIPNSELESYYACGWAYVMPDFDKPGHSKIEWLSDKMPVYPPRSQKPLTENANDRTNNRRQQPA